jgi:hypothetical protein
MSVGVGSFMLGFSLFCSSESFAERILAFACVEGIFFSGRWGFGPKIHGASVSSKFEISFWVSVCCVGTHFMDAVDQSLPAVWLLLTWSLSLFAAFVQSSGWRKEVLCQDWHSQMNSSQGMRGCTVTLLVFFTGKISSNGHFWKPKLNTWMMEELLYTNLTHRYSGNCVIHSVTLLLFLLLI